MGSGSVVDRRPVRKSPYFTDDHESFRESVRRFVQKEVAPHIDAWEAAGGFPRDIIEKMGDLGYLGIMYPEELGGIGLDFFFTVVFLEELCRCGAAGFPGAVSVHSYMATPPLWKQGTESVKKNFLMPAIAGRKIGALAITEPDCGSDVAAIRTRARLDGDHWVVNGAKTFITNGCVADFVTTAVRTSDGEGHDGISLVVIDTHLDGFMVSKRLKKLGWHSSDTAEITFDNVRVPKDCLLGEEGQGFYYLMDNFRIERLVAAVASVGGMQWLLDESVEYALGRRAFKRPLAKFQVLRHRFADLATSLESVRQLCYHAAWLFERGEDAICEITMAKLAAAELNIELSDRCLQVYGGYGFMEEYPAARAYRDARLMSIGGGTSEIMREIIAGIVIDGRTHKAGDAPRKAERRAYDAKPVAEGSAPTNGKETSVDNCKAFFDSLPGRFKADKAGDWSTRVVFEISGERGGEFTVYIHDGKCEVFHEKQGAPKATVKTDDATYMGIENGTVKPEAAFMAGKVKVDNLGEMMKYANCFSRLA